MLAKKESSPTKSWLVLLVSIALSVVWMNFQSGFGTVYLPAGVFISYTGGVSLIAAGASNGGGACTVD